MSLVVKQVQGIDEPVSIVTSKGFAVGIESNNVYSWTTMYQNSAERADEKDLLISTAKII